MQSLVAKIDRLDSDLREVPGWSALNSDVTRMVCAAKLAEGLRANLVSIAESPEHLVKLRHELRQLVVESNEMLAPDGSIAGAVGQLAMCHKALVDATETFGNAAGSEIDLEKDVPKLLANAQAVVENQQALNGWCSWQRVRQEAVSSGLQPLVEAIENATLSGSSAAEVFEVAYARWFAAKAIDAEPLL